MQLDLPNEWILEVRYPTNLDVMDRKGEIGHHLAAGLELKDWRVSEVRVDVLTPDENLQAFVGVKNAGIVLRDVELDDYFPNHALRFLKAAAKMGPLSSKTTVERLGMRLRVGIPVTEPMAAMVAIYKERLVTPTREAESAIGGRLSDIGLLARFDLENGAVSINSGPMAREQLRQFFPFKSVDDLPSVACYVDVDFWQMPTTAVGDAEVVSFIRTGSKQVTQTYSKLRAVLKRS